MKKLITSLIVFSALSLPVFADNVPDLGLKKIKNKETISYNRETGNWSNRVDRKSGENYTRTKGFGIYYDYLNSNKEFAFSTECEHEFLYGNKFVAHSNNELNFYEIGFEDGVLTKRLMDKEEVQEMLPDYHVISLSDFSDKTNALKVKKKFGTLKIVLLNDTGLSLTDYTFTSGNSKFEQFDMNGVIYVDKSGMIQFSGNSSNSESTPWYILLVR